MTTRRSPLLLLLAVLSTGLWLGCARPGPAGAEATVTASHLTLSQDDVLHDLSVVDRASSPELYFNVTLKDVPMGAPLSLTGAWVNPEGRTVRTNKWDTRPIDHLPWTTHCRCQLTRSDVPGPWHVSMSMGGRPIAQKTFTVR